MTVPNTTEIRLSEVAVRLKLSPIQVYVLICRGDLQGEKRGRQWVVSRASLEAYEEGRAKA